MDWSRLPLFVALFAGLGGCASDAVDPPEPTLETGGAFVASEHLPGEIVIFRMLGALKLENGETVLLMRRFAERASSFAHAKSLAQQRDLAIDVPLMSMPKSELVTRPHRVVWFRTLTEQERDALH